MAASPPNPGSPVRRTDVWPLFGVSFVALFLELAMIRWLNASVPILAWFNNLVLVSCFFGLGLGCLLARRELRFIRGWAPMLLLLVVAVDALAGLGIEVSHRGDFVFAPDEQDYYQTRMLGVSGSALAGFLLSVSFFVLLGQELGRRLAAVGDPLSAYGWDIGGSLAGVVLFGAAAWAGTTPWVWFTLGALVLLVLSGSRRWWLEAVVAVAAIVLVARGAAVPEGESVTWSPYYKVQTEPLEVDGRGRDPGFRILVDNVRIQDALDLRPEMSDSPVVGGWMPYYELPYHFLRPRRVLVLGAGAGNEVAVAKRLGAEVVHAVEIDPAIAAMGFDRHPLRPYALPGVEVFVDDARSYVSACEETYDLVVMSALDSHRQIPGMSSLRLESFVYTVEGFRAMRALVAPGGLFCLNVSSYRPWIGERVYWTLADAFEEQPARWVTGGMGLTSVAYTYGPLEAARAVLAGRGLLPGGSAVQLLPPLEAPGVEGLAGGAADGGAASPPLRSTDDWPHLYLEGPAIPALYLWVIGVMMVLSAVLVGAAEPSARRPSLHMFLLGAGFMLLETRSVTQLALLFGSTWHVNAVVFAAILTTILVANRLVQTGRHPSRRTSYALLFVTLAAGWVFPFEILLDLDGPVRTLAAGLVVGLPILFASFVFSISFREATDTARAFGSNLLGVVMGGCLEHLANLWGLQALFLVALVVYAGSALGVPRVRAAGG